MAIRRDLRAIGGNQGVVLGRFASWFMEQQGFIGWFGAVEIFGNICSCVQARFYPLYVFALLLQLLPEGGFHFITLIFPVLNFAGVIFETFLNLGIVDRHGGIITKASRFAVQGAWLSNSSRLFGVEQKYLTGRLEDTLIIKEHKMNKKMFVVLVSTLLIGALALSGCAQTPVKAENTVSQTSQQTTPIRTLSVSGDGKVTLVPDIAYINIGVHSEAMDVTAALQQNNDLAKQIADALVASGVDAKDIQTANFNIYPKTNYDPQTGNSTPAGFSVDNTVYITVRDLKNLGKLLDTAIRAGANQIYGISFDITDRATALVQARDLAIKDAQQKALEVAKVSGVELGLVQAINVSDTSFVQPYNQSAGMGGGGASGKGMDSSVPVSAGQIVITYTVSMIYAIN